LFVHIFNAFLRNVRAFRLLLKLVDEVGFVLAEEFFWFNPSKLPSPIEWVNKRKIRVKDAVNFVFWLAKDDFPKTYVEKVLIDYSDRMRQLLRLRERFYRPKKRPSGHDISDRFMESKKAPYLRTYWLFRIRKATLNTCGLARC
jgi:site-specific DNA-methyltransferase (cytosine-N4-specific)